ncbi:MAG TPA: hypothetical protein VHG51_10600 [Longimicrobiaceae bacterium]|nr:hypothetical protein [Longimicrobiaceae bacterium]
MRAHPHNRLRVLLWLLLLGFGADQSVAFAEEIRSEGETGHVWVQHSGARAPAGRLLSDFPDGAAALPASPAELPPSTILVRAAAPERRPLPPHRPSRRTEYPRGPPA